MEEERQERLKKIIQAKQRLAGQKNFWVVNAYTPLARAGYKVFKQIDEGMARNGDMLFIVAEEIKVLQDLLLQTNEIAKRLCQKLKVKYDEPSFLKRYAERISKLGEEGER